MKKRLTYLIASAAFLSIIALLWGPTIRNEVTASLLIRQDSPDQNAIHSVIASSHDPEEMLNRLWQTESIPHRYLALTYLNNHAADFPTPSPTLETIIEQSITNVDNHVRELALGILYTRAPESLPNALRRLLYDSDLELRMTALNILRQTNNQQLMAEIVRLLDDPEPKVAAAAAGLLRYWTRNDFGVRNQDAVAKHNPDGSRTVSTENHNRLLQGLEQWKRWWTTVADKYPPLNPSNLSSIPPKLTTSDFQLENLDGTKTSLSEFRGKTVILNFWTTWCTACAIEVPDLVALHNRHPDDLVILAISLDGAYGHGDDLATFVDREEASRNGWDNAAQAQNIPGIRKKILRVVQKTGINYRVLHDPSGKIGNRFNGQELPTNVLIDKDGFVRRRFIGSRPLSNWEALITEIQ